MKETKISHKHASTTNPAPIRVLKLICKGKKREDGLIWVNASMQEMYITRVWLARIIYALVVVTL